MEPKVLYIVGKGRSGSTLLDLLLGEIDGFFSAGQLSRLWEQGLLSGNDCGCGDPVTRCVVWTAVLDRFDPELDPRRIMRLQDEVLSWRRVPRMLRAVRRGSADWPELEAYGAMMSRLYRAITAVTGDRVIVDSSKAPAHPGSLGLVPGIVPYVIHLVRDPRAVAYSWRRRKPARGRHDVREMPRYGPFYSGTSWLVRNVSAERTRRSLGPARSMLVRYEDLAERPAETVAAIAGMLGERAELPFIDERTVKLTPNHTPSGNPIRTDAGEIEIRPDREWSERIRPWDRRVVSLLTSPVRKRYGY